VGLIGGWRGPVSGDPDRADGLGGADEGADLGAISLGAPDQPERSRCQVLDGHEYQVVASENGNADHRDVHDLAVGDVCSDLGDAAHELSPGDGAA
jgi:hypothetical protein